MRLRKVLLTQIPRARLMKGLSWCFQWLFPTRPCSWWSLKPSPTHRSTGTFGWRSTLRIAGSRWRSDIPSWPLSSGTSHSNSWHVVDAACEEVSSQMIQHIGIYFCFTHLKHNNDLQMCFTNDWICNWNFYKIMLFPLKIALFLWEIALIDTNFNYKFSYLWSKVEGHNIENTPNQLEAV